MHEKHKGHDSMHAQMFLIMFATLILAQVGLVQWRKLHVKSYQNVTLFLMWLVPAAISLKFSWFRFIVVWFLVTCVTAYVCHLATRQPVNNTTPRLVYKWFFLVFKVSYWLGIAGYLCFMFTLFGLNLLFAISPQVSMDFALLIVFYGIYFGVVGRDMAELCSDKMASRIGYTSSTGLPGRQLENDVCAICSNKLMVKDGEEGVIENTYKLNCDHLFHEFCIRGWCIVGKKQTCPYCKEKVDLKKMFPSPWERPHVIFGSLLDWVRYLVTWQPVIFLLIQGINWALGLE